MTIVLDTFPASSIGRKQGKTRTLSDDCRQWIDDCEAAGHQILIPAIAYYEALREFEMLQATARIQRFQVFCLQTGRFIPPTTAHLETAAQLWGQARRTGRQTADPQALDGDMILCAQVLSLGLSPADYIVATTNVKHLAPFVNATDWQTIAP